MDLASTKPGSCWSCKYEKIHSFTQNKYRHKNWPRSLGIKPVKNWFDFTCWCLVWNGWVAGGMGWLLHIITSDYGSFPHSLLLSTSKFSFFPEFFPPTPPLSPSVWGSRRIAARPACSITRKPLVSNLNPLEAANKLGGSTAEDLLNSRRLHWSKKNIQKLEKNSGIWDV